MASLIGGDFDAMPSELGDFNGIVRLQRLVFYFMKNKLCVIAATLLLTGCGRIADTDAAHCIGQNKTVEGVGTATLAAGNDRGGMVYLTFGFPPPHQDFMVAGLNRDQMGAGLTQLELAHFVNYRVRVSGKIETYEIDGQKYPGIFVTDLSSIKIQ
jgi:hypothetical protein